MSRIADITNYVTVMVFINDFGIYMLIVLLSTGGNLWLVLTELLGCAEPLLKTNGLYHDQLHVWCNVREYGTRQYFTFGQL